MKKLAFFALLLSAMSITFISCELDEEDDLIVHEIIGESITTNVTWDVGTYIIDGSLYIQEGGHLTIQPGSIIKFLEGGKIVVTGSNSTLTAVGTVSEPITFTSNSTAPSAGDWDYINFTSSSSSASQLAYCNIEYGGGYASSYGGMVWLEGVHISIDNCTISNSGYHGIVCEDDSYFSTFTNNTLTDNTAYGISIEGNWAHTIGAGNILNGKGILVEGDTFEHTSETWLLQTAPYTIDGTLYIKHDNGAELIIDAGNTIQFTEGGKIEVGYNAYGTLKANGTEELPILFTSTATQKQPGQWDYIDFGPSSTNTSILNHCIIEAGGGYASYYGTVILEECNINITNTEIRMSEAYGISLHTDAYFTTFTGNYIHDCNSYEIYIQGNSVHTIGEANEWDENGMGIKVDGDYYDQLDETWLAQSTAYVIDGNIYVGSASGSILRIEAGATLKFTEGHYIEVGASDYGSLVAVGTASEPITFTTSAPVGTEQPGQWDGIFFGDNTMNGAILDYCTISYGGGYSAYSNNGNINLNSVPSGLPTISNCTISYSEGYGIYNSDSSPTLLNNTFVGNANGDMGSK
jgi:parallel beta-helix repeat protein